MVFEPNLSTQNPEKEQNKVAKGSLPMPHLQASFPIGFFQIGFQNPKRFSFGLGSHCNS
jgi:hypothetical protein